jgi:hypothetical protein
MNQNKRKSVINRDVRKLLALAFLVLWLVFPAATPQADEGVHQPNTEMVMAVRRVRTATLTPKQAQTVLMQPLQGVIVVRGNTIRALDGNAIWQLTNGSFGIFSPEPTVSAMEMWTKDLGDGVIYFVVCYCPGSDPNVDDGCRFNPPGNPAGQCGGATTCCTKIEGIIDENGIPIIF